MWKRLAAVTVLVILSSPSTAQTPDTLALLDQYAAGRFADVEATLARTENFKRIYKDLRSDELKAWLAAGGPADRDRRELAAATFALEAARADEWYEWKWIVRAPDGKLPILYWMPPPLLIEWGCELLRQTPEPRPIERVWQLAAMAVAQRSEDTQFLIGFTKLESDEIIVAPPPAPAVAAPVGSPQPNSPEMTPKIPLPRGIAFRGGDYFPDEVVNVQKEIGHLNHIVERFPGEKRFMLGEGLARERPSAADAVKVYLSLLSDPTVGGEAAVRLGSLYLRMGRMPDALVALDRADAMTRDPDLVYLARFYRGQAMLRMRREPDAVAAFRTALAARPGTQSASAALASILVRRDQRGEAQALMKAVLEMGSAYKDPHLEYMHGDERFWPRLIAQLHKAIAR